MHTKEKELNQENLPEDVEFITTNEILNEAGQEEDLNYQVLVQFKKGEVSELEVVQQFERLIYYVIKRYNTTYTPHVLLADEDCYNICLFKLFSSIAKYEPTRGKVTTYMVKSMLSALVDEYKHNNRAKRAGNVISLNNFMTEENDGLANILFFKYARVEFMSELMYQEVKRNVLDVINGLSAKEQSKKILIDLFINERRPKDICAQYGVTPQVVTYVKKWFSPQIQFELKRRKLI